MRIGFLLSGSLDTLTGGYIYDRHLVDYLRRSGHRVDLVRLPCRGYMGRLLYSPGPIFRQIEDWAPDILLEDELDHAALLRLNRRLKRRGVCPVIAIVHNLRSREMHTAWQNRFYGWLEKRYLSGVDGFIFSSRATGRLVEGLVGMLKPEVTAPPGGDRLPVHITETEIRERALKAGPLRVVFLGNLLPNKAVHVLLAALAGLPRNSCLLTVIGDLDMDKGYVSALRGYMRRHNLHDGVALAGPLNNLDLAAELRESHVLAVPSFYEAFGIAYLEGMGFGLPAIGTSAGAAGEIITHGLNGFLVPPGDSAAVSRYLRDLNERRDLLASMSLNARRSFKSHPTWQDGCARVASFLLSLRK